MQGSLSPQTRWAWAQINLGALRQNVRLLRNLTPQNCKTMCVVKANAYGHGAVEVAKACKAAGTDMFGVATLDEGIELREAGIKEPILVLSEPPIAAIDGILTYGIMPSICTSEFALALGESAAARHMSAPYHLKIDTGMNRIGVNHLDAKDFLSYIDFHKGITLQGIYTHFATADNPNDWDFALQLKRFIDCLKDIHDAGFDTGIVHCCNSAGTILHPEAHFDMVRLGTAMYGLYPSEECAKHIELEPVMSIHARATYVKRPQIGEGVSYGLTYRLAKQVQIATLPIGYADGLPRCASNKIDALYRGKRCRQVGTICMDQCMLEVDSNIARRDPLEPIEIGDEVVLVGQMGNERISMEELAKLSNSMNIELSSLFGIRLKRVYTQS